MSALARFESFMEDMVEGSVARLFRSPVQPSEIAKRLERAMEAQQIISVKRVIVPSSYRVFLNPKDLGALSSVRAEMEREMANYLVDLAQERNFALLEHPQVTLAEDTSVPQRGIQVVAEPPAAPDQAAPPSETQVISRGGAAAGGPQSRPAQPRAALVLAGKQTIPLESTLVTVGRGLNNDIILEDARVSRTHAQIRYRARRFWVADVGSTNGTYVNGAAVEEQALKHGDVISLGGLEIGFQEGRGA